MLCLAQRLQPPDVPGWLIAMPTWFAMIARAKQSRARTTGVPAMPRCVARSEPGYRCNVNRKSQPGFPRPFPMGCSRQGPRDCHQGCRRRKVIQLLSAVGQIAEGGDGDASPHRHVLPGLSDGSTKGGA
jgi:hypothetical protein